MALLCTPHLPCTFPGSANAPDTASSSSPKQPHMRSGPCSCSLLQPNSTVHDVPSMSSATVSLNALNTTPNPWQTAASINALALSQAWNGSETKATTVSHQPPAIPAAASDCRRDTRAPAIVFHALLGRAVEVHAPACDMHALHPKTRSTVTFQINRVVQLGSATPPGLPWPVPAACASPAGPCRGCHSSQPLSD